MKSKKILIIIFSIVIMLSYNYILASDVFSSNEGVYENDDATNSVEQITTSAKEAYDLDEYIETINKSVNENLGQEVDFKDIANELLNKNNINHKNVVTKLLE